MRARTALMELPLQTISHYPAEGLNSVARCSTGVYCPSQRLDLDRRVKTMTHEEKAQALLGSPAGSALVLELSANLHLPLDHFAEPKMSFWLASNAIDFADVNRDAGWQDIALREARARGDLALRIVSNPAFAWWYEPFDPENQIWSSPQMPHGLNPPDSFQPFDPGSWQQPAPPRINEDRPVPRVPSQTTSTLRVGSTSAWTAFVTRSAEHVCAFPLAVWRVRFRQSVRVREINNPSDWHDLCLEFPHRAPDGRLMPNWREVAEAWDGVHVTLGGVLSCEQARYERDGEWSMMQFWHVEETWWINRLELTGERMPDILEDHNHQNLKAFFNGRDLLRQSLRRFPGAKHPPGIILLRREEPCPSPDSSSP